MMFQPHEATSSVKPSGADPNALQGMNVRSRNRPNYLNHTERFKHPEEIPYEYETPISNDNEIRQSKHLSNTIQRSSKKKPGRREEHRSIPYNDPRQVSEGYLGRSRRNDQREERDRNGKMIHTPSIDDPTRRSKREGRERSLPQMRSQEASSPRRKHHPPRPAPTQLPRQVPAAPRDAMSRKTTTDSKRYQDWERERPPPRDRGHRRDWNQETFWEQAQTASYMPPQSRRSRMKDEYSHPERVQTASSSSDTGGHTYPMASRRAGRRHEAMEESQEHDPRYATYSSPSYDGGSHGRKRSRERATYPIPISDRRSSVSGGITHVHNYYNDCVVIVCTDLEHARVLTADAAQGLRDVRMATSAEIPNHVDRRHPGRRPEELSPPRREPPVTTTIAEEKKLPMRGLRRDEKLQRQDDYLTYVALHEKWRGKGYVIREQEVRPAKHEITPPTNPRAFGSGFATPEDWNPFGPSTGPPRRLPATITTSESNRKILHSNTIKKEGPSHHRRRSSSNQSTFHTAAEDAISSKFHSPAEEQSQDHVYNNNATEAERTQKKDAFENIPKGSNNDAAENISGSAHDDDDDDRHRKRPGDIELEETLTLDIDDVSEGSEGKGNPKKEAKTKRPIQEDGNEGSHSDYSTDDGSDSDDRKPVSKAKRQNRGFRT